MKEEFRKIVSRELADGRETLKKFFQSHAGGDELPPALWESLEAVYEHTVAVVGRIADRLEEEAAGPRSTLPSIVTVLAPAEKEKELNRLGFYEIPDTALGRGPALPDAGARQGLSGFLKVPYEKFGEYLDRTYTGSVGGKERRYTLRPEFHAVEAETLLRAVADLYDLPEPLLFSPWSRRAVSIRFEGDEPFPAPGDSDLELAKNGLADVLLTDRVLMWNVGASYLPEGAESSSVAPERDMVWHTSFYTGLDDSVLILPDLGDSGPDPASLRWARSQGRLEISAPVELPRACWKIEITRPNTGLVPEECLFCGHEPDFPALERHGRLRTRADIRHVLAALSHSGFRASPETEPGPVMARYRREHRYPAYDLNDRRDAARPRPTVYVRFEGDPLYLADHAEYTLHFLENSFPEILWKGLAR